jgi:hypothetical protein
LNTTFTSWVPSSSAYRATRDTFDATIALAEQANLIFPQFVLLTKFRSAFEKWATHDDNRQRHVLGVPITRHWLIPKHQRHRLYSPPP